MCVCEALLSEIKATLEREPSVSSGMVVHRVQRNILNDLMEKHRCTSPARMQGRGLHSSTFQLNSSTFQLNLVIDSNHQTRHIPPKVMTSIDG
jgi:hypothetical protein